MSPHDLETEYEVRKALVLTGVAGLLILTACGNKDGGGTKSGASSPATSAAAAKADPAKFGPNGYGGYTLGESMADAKAAGLDVNESGACLSSGEIKAASGVADVLISTKLGIYLIYTGDPIATPEGIKVGSTLDEAKKAYPGLTGVSKDYPAGEGPNYVAVPGNDKVTYELNVTGGKVDKLSMRLADCTD
jgi:hypothetical protein